MSHPFVFDCYMNEPIIIGLTGNTGSGCTTVATLIKSLEVDRDFDVDLNAIEDDLERRAFRVVYSHFRSSTLTVHTLSAGDFISRALFSNVDNLDYLITFIDKMHVTQKEDLLKALNEQMLAFKNFTDHEGDDDWLKRASSRLKDVLRTHTVVFGNGPHDSRRQANCYTYIYQELGNTLRKTGRAALQHEDTTGEGRSLVPVGSRINEKTLTTVAHLIDEKVKPLHQEAQNKKDDSTVLVIDAIRSPFEALYFSKKYPNFYLVAVNRPESERIHALRINGIRTAEIEDIDHQEYPNEFDLKNCHKVNIRKCEEMADVYVVNESAGRDSTTASMRRQLIRHLVLMLKPGIVNPTSIEACMQVANSMKLRSGCLSRQVGAVVADKDYKILSVGWNTAPGNQVPCNLRNAYDLARGEDRQAFSEYENDNQDFRNHMNLKLQLHRCATSCDRRAERNGVAESFFPYCFKDVYNGIKKSKNQVHTRSIHGEEMAFLDEAVDCKDGILFTTSSPCELCAKKAYHKGIARIYYLVPYPGIAHEHILKGGARKLTVALFRGVTGSAYTKLYTPLIPRKDEDYMKSCFGFKKNLEGVRIRSAVSGGHVGPVGSGARYLRVVETDGEDKLSIGLATRDLSSKFDIVEEDCKVAIRFTLERLLERRGATDKCPLCQAQPVKQGQTCEYCGFPDAGSDHEGPDRVEANRQKVQVYLCSDLNANGRVRANRMHRYVWEQFKIRFVNERKFCLQSMANDMFVRTDENGELIADEDASVQVDATPAVETCYFEFDLGEAKANPYGEELDRA